MGFFAAFQKHLLSRVGGLPALGAETSKERWRSRQSECGEATTKQTSSAVTMVSQGQEGQGAAPSRM